MRMFMVQGQVKWRKDGRREKREEAYQKKDRCERAHLWHVEESLAEVPGQRLRVWKHQGQVRGIE